MTAKLVFFLHFAFHVWVHMEVLKIVSLVHFCGTFFLHLRKNGFFWTSAEKQPWRTDAAADLFFVLLLLPCLFLTIPPL